MKMYGVYAQLFVRNNIFEFPISRHFIFSLPNNRFSSSRVFIFSRKVSRNFLEQLQNILYHRANLADLRRIFEIHRTSF